MSELAAMLRLYVAGDDREEADRCAMLRLAEELEQPLSRTQVRAHFTASAFVVDETGERACLVEHAKLGRMLQPGGHSSRPTRASRTRRCARRVKRPGSTSSCTLGRRARSTSTSTPSRRLRTSPPTSISTCATS